MNGRDLLKYVNTALQKTLNNSDYTIKLDLLNPFIDITKKGKCLLNYKLNHHYTLLSFYLDGKVYKFNSDSHLFDREIQEEYFCIGKNKDKTEINESEFLDALNAFILDLN